MRAAAILLISLVLAGSALAEDARPFPSVTIDADKRTATLKSGKAEVTLRGETTPDSSGEVMAVARLTYDGKAVGELAAGSADYPATAGLVEMDPANDTPELVLEAYTGGTHCCTDVEVLTKVGDGRWREVVGGEFDGDTDLIEDADKDGRYEIVAPDDEFFYTFGCYACSVAPLRVSDIESGELRDVTFEPRYQARHRDYLGWLEANASEKGNGYLAGWVAEKIILGEGAEAWADMLLAYDKNDDWGLKFCPGDTTDCSDSEAIPRPFPDVLKEFLVDRGYTF